jgi:hypothetical protein
MLIRYNDDAQNLIGEPADDVEAAFAHAVTTSRWLLALD